MIYGCLIICRSITYAQRAQKILRSMGYTVSIVRPGPEIIGESCGYALKISQYYLTGAVSLLRKNGIEPVKIVNVDENGNVLQVKI